MDILSAERLTKVYGQGPTALKALDSVTLSIGQGEFVAIVGSSGSGKSTLLHLMGGVDRPTSGTVRLAGADVYARTDEELAVLRRREVGLVYQFYNLIPVLNVVENMTLPVLMDGRPVNEERLGTLLDGLGLRGHEGFLPNQLSGGQQQRVAIGRALMNAPAVVLADEPTGNLDSRNSREIMGLLRDSNRHFDQTLVVITHDEDIARTADRVIAIEDGRVASDERRRSWASSRASPCARSRETACAPPSPWRASRCPRRFWPPCSRAWAACRRRLWSAPRAPPRSWARSPPSFASAVDALADSDQVSDLAAFSKGGAAASDADARKPGRLPHAEEHAHRG